MKPTNQFKIGKIFPLFILFISLQSCNVYHSPSYSIDTAIEKEKKIKILDKSMQSYEFEYISRDGDNMIGHAKTKSKTAKLLQSEIIERSDDGKMVSIEINPDNVAEIRVKNGVASTGTKVGTGLIIAGAVLFTAFILSFAL